MKAKRRRPGKAAPRGGWLPFGQKLVTVASFAVLAVSATLSQAPVTPKMEWETDGAVEIDTKTSIATVTGATHFTYEGEQKAEVTCRNAVIKFGKGYVVLSMTAQGPVQVKMVTTGPNAQTTTANCTKTTSYDQESDTITMVGNVVATMQQAGEEAKLRDFTLRGERATLQLKTGNVRVEAGGTSPARGSVTLPEKKPKEEATQDKPPAKEQEK